MTLLRYPPRPTVCAVCGQAKPWGVLCGRCATNGSRLDDWWKDQGMTSDSHETTPGETRGEITGAQTVTMKTLADFKRFLGTPGATVQVVRNDWADPTKQTHPITPKAGYWDPKQVERVQSNAVKFTTGSYLTFPKAAHLRVEGDTVTIDMEQDGSFRHVLVYRCSVGGTA